MLFCRRYEFTRRRRHCPPYFGQQEWLREAGFELTAIEGQVHVGGLAATGQVAPRLAAALRQAGW